MKLNHENIRYLKIQSITKASQRFLLFILIFIQIILLPQELLSNLKWKIFGNLKEHRQLHSAVAISKTEILVIGGYDNTNTTKDLSSCEIIDIAKDTILSGPSMFFPRAYFATLVTKDSNIIVISGCTSGTDQLTPAVEMFVNSTRTWRLLGTLQIPRWQHCAEFLNDHEIIVIGGRHGDTRVMSDIEIFDINTGQSRLINPFPFPTSDGVCGTTSNGKIISFGGREGGTNSNRSKYIYEYNLINDNWIIIDSVNIKINMPTLIKLFDNRLLIIGGIYEDSPAIVTDEVYIENNGQFINSGKILTGRFRFPMVQFNNDSVLVIGGYYDYNKCTNKCEWYNFNTNETAPAPDLNFARYNFAAVSMPDPNDPGKNVVLAIGGNDNRNQSLNTVEILMDSVSYSPPAISDISQDCFKYYFTVSDSNLIDSVELTGPNNRNVAISVVEPLPAIAVHVIITLIDQRRDGIFNVTCFSNNTGLSTDITDTIHGGLSYLFASLPVEGTKIFIVDTIVNAVKCINIILENKGSEDITLDSAMFYSNKEFSVPGNQLPMVIPSNQQKQLTICFISEFSGLFSDTLLLTNFCDTLGLTVHGLAYDNKASEIIDSSFDCDNYYITVADSNYINRVELSGTENVNVKITVIENLPSRIVHVIITLINPLEDGVFTLTAYSSASGKSVDFNGVIYSRPASLLVLAPLDSGKIYVGKTEFGNLKCIKVLLQNTGTQQLVLDYVRLFRNIEFSIPQSQLPIVIPAKERRELELCYLPSALEEQWDTLQLNDLCDTLTIPVKAVGDTAYYNGKSKCSIPVVVKTKGSWRNLVVSNPYPNPGNITATVEVLSENEYNSEVSCVMLSNIGNFISNPSDILNDDITLDGIKFRNQKFIFKLNELASGSYFIRVISGETKKVLPYFILR